MDVVLKVLGVFYDATGCNTRGLNQIVRSFYESELWWRLRRGKSGAAANSQTGTAQVSVRRSSFVLRDRGERFPVLIEEQIAGAKEKKY
jgi:hypothetical protein